MNRREFLRRALSLTAPAIILPPAVTYFLPPRGGWPLGAAQIEPTIWPFAARPATLHADRLWGFDGEHLYGSARLSPEQIAFAKEMLKRHAPQPLPGYLTSITRFKILDPA